jgi:GT2 family glycosyltransferase
MRVSVVIPTYNRAKRLPAAIDSVLRQGLDETEIIVVDDGSVDDTRAVVARYGDRVNYVYQENAGVGSARNTGIRQATGEFIAFLDSDDRWRDFKLSMQLALFASRPRVGLVFSDFVIETPDGTEQPHGAALWAGRDLDFPEMTRVQLASPASAGVGQSPPWPIDPVECWSGPMYRQLVDELPILTSSVVVRRAALDATTLYAERVILFEDWEFFARVARRADVGYVALPTTVNVGHLDPGRVSKCSPVERAEAYQTLLERVWLADPDFMALGPATVQSVHSRALLAVAREALLAGEHERARTALAAWRRSGATDRREWAAVYELCARVPAGRLLLRNVLRGRTAVRLLTGARAKGHGSVKPAD